MSQNAALTFQKPGDLMGYLQKAKGQIGLALPKHLNPDRMLRLAVTCFSTNRQLQDCTAQSILSSIIVASQLGLEPGISGQGYLIPYRDNRKGITVCTFIPGWQGLVGLLNNTGRATAWTGAVFNGDDFTYELGSNPHIKHKPGENFGDPAQLAFFYACGKVNGSEIPVIEVWSFKRVMKHRDRFNKVGTKHYSYEHPEMYGRKVALMQVLKYMPKSIELQNAMTAHDAGEDGRAPIIQDGVVVDIQTEQVSPNGQAGAEGVEGNDGPGTPEGSPFARQHAQEAPEGPPATPTPPEQTPPQNRPETPKPAPAKKTAPANPPNPSGDSGELGLATPKPLALLRERLTKDGIAEWEVIDICKASRIPCKGTLDASGDALATLLLNDFDTFKERVEEAREKAKK